MHQGCLQHSGSDYRLSISSSQDPGGTAWTHSGRRARGRDPHFDVSHEVRQGAGGEGRGGGLLETISSPISGFPRKTGRRQLLLAPLSSLSCVGPGLCPSLGAAPRFLSQTCVLHVGLSLPFPVCPGSVHIPSLPPEGQRGTVGHLGRGLNPPTWFVVDSAEHVVMTSGRKVREDHFP